MRRLLSTAVVVAMFAAVGANAGEPGAKCKYVGGTLTVAEKTNGAFDLSRDTEAIFRFKGGETLVPYDRIESIEYGQKAGRRVGAAVVVSPLFLLSKKRKHYVTIGYLDADGIKQGAVFEVEKNGVYGLVTTLSTRSGIEVEYESEEARKHLQKEAK